MKGRTHDLAAATGLAIAVVVVSPLPPLSLATVILAFVANQLGGIAPDIDQPTAPFWRNLPIGGLFGRVVGKMLGGHRFLTHSLIGLVLMGFLVHWLLVFLQPIMPNVQIDYVWWAFIIGMISHLIMDSFTREGVPWLLPIPIKLGFPPLRRLRITTGKNIENFVVFPLIALILIFICSMYYPIFVDLLHRRIIA
ncbi:MAG: Membrane protein containing transrane [Candidatus Saccharibacteria bacterium]|nr:Membrane protein containing transrane [Candidatus Saccharibacteria bacterium]